MSAVRTEPSAAGPTSARGACDSAGRQRRLRKEFEHFPTYFSAMHKLCLHYVCNEYCTSGHRGSQRTHHGRGNGSAAADTTSSLPCP